MRFTSEGIYCVAKTSCFFPSCPDHINERACGWVASKVMVMRWVLQDADCGEAFL